MTLSELLAELEGLPLIASKERWNEARCASGSEMLKLADDYRLTETPRKFSEQIAALPEDDFEKSLAIIIQQFPNTHYEPATYNMRVLCTVAAHAFMQRHQKRDTAKRLLLSAFAVVKSYEIDIPTFDDSDTADRTQNVNIIDYLITRVAGLGNG